MLTKFADCRRRLIAIERHEIFRRPLERIYHARQRLDHDQRALLLSMTNRVRLWTQKISRLSLRLQSRHPRQLLALAHQRNQAVSERLSRAVQQILFARRNKLSALQGRLIALAPTEVL